MFRHHIGKRNVITIVPKMESESECRLPPCCKFSDAFSQVKTIVGNMRFEERHIDALHVIDLISEFFPPQCIQNDVDFVEIIYRNRLIRIIYDLLELAENQENLKRKSKKFWPLKDDFQSELRSLKNILSSNCVKYPCDCKNSHCELLEVAKLCSSSPYEDISMKDSYCSDYPHGHGPNFYQKLCSDENLVPLLKNSLLEKVFCHLRHPLVAGNRPREWQLAVDDGESLRINVRNYEDNPELLTFRIEGIIESPLLCILSVLNEVDLFKRWVPYYTNPFRLGLREVEATKLGRVDQIVQFHVDFPWPFAKRDACFEVWAVDDFERNNQILVKMTGLDHEQPNYRLPVSIPKPHEGVERICVDGSLVIIPLGRDASRLRLLWHENCRMRVPMKMVNFVSRMFAKQAFGAFRNACKSAMYGEHENRRKTNRFLYSFVENRLSEVNLMNCDMSLSGITSGNPEGEVKSELKNDEDPCSESLASSGSSALLGIAISR